MTNTRKRRPKIDPRSIDVTDEYDVFKRLAGNRELNEKHVQRLMDAMRKNDLFVPILVNQEFEVVDGQHRLEARKRLGLPVPYYWTEGLGLTEVQNLNSTQKGWRNNDYVKAYIELGNQNYVIYKWFRENYGTPHTPTIMLLTGRDSRDIRHMFQSGQLVVKDLEGAKHKAQMLSEIGKYFAHWKEASFIKAFLIAMNREGFSYKIFLDKLKKNPTMLRPSVSIDAYLQEIEAVYNYRAQKKVPIRFGKDNEEEERDDEK